MKRFKRRSARMNILHFHVLIRRYFRQIFTNPGVLLPLVLQAPVMLLIFAVVCRSDAFAVRDVTGANLAIFMLVIMCALMGLLNSYREICKEREILSREVFGGLDVTAYVFSKFFVVFVIGAAQSLLLYAGALLLVDFPFANVGEYALGWLALLLTNVSTAAIGLLISALLKKSESAILPVLLVIIMQVVFADCLISLDGAAACLRYVTPAAWGAAVFGRLCGINGWYPEIEWYHRDLYEANPLLSVLVLAAFAAVFVWLTAWRLRRAYRQKD